MNKPSISILSLEHARNWYSDSDPVHGFDHIARVYHMAIYLAESEGADAEIVAAAALLHDASDLYPESDLQIDQATPTARVSHHHSSADFAERFLSAQGWTNERIVAVQHCILTHRFRTDREKPETIEAKILFDADKLDAIGAIGVARAIAYALHAKKPIFAPVSNSFQKEGILSAGEAHSSYHEYIFKLRHLKDRLYTATARAIAESRHQLLVDYFTQLAAEWAGES